MKKILLLLLPILLIVGCEETGLNTESLTEGTSITDTLYVVNYDTIIFNNYDTLYVTDTIYITDIHGCLDSQATNYDASASIDNNSCTYIDSCGVIDIDKTNDCTADCNGDWGGTSYIDDCYDCVGGNTGLEPNYAKDECGICDGDGWDNTENFSRWCGDLNILQDLIDLNENETGTWAEWSNNTDNTSSDYGRIIELSGSGLDTIPESFGNLTELKEISFNNGYIKVLPESFGNLTELTKIVISYNRFPTLPSRIGNLSKLQYLHLNDNKLISIPEEIGLLANLKNLQINDNLLTSLPESICNIIPNLDSFEVRGNCICDDIDELPSCLNADDIGNQNCGAGGSCESP